MIKNEDKIMGNTSNILRFFLWLVLPIVAIISFWILWYNTLINDGYYFYLYLFLITFVFILMVSSFWALLRVPSLAQKKGYNVYAWIVLAWFFGIISFFILKGLACNNKLSIENEKVSLNNLDKAALNTADTRPNATINKVLAQNNMNVISKTTNTYSQQRVSYSAWVCPKCGEKNNYAAKNCINCFEPRP